MDCRHAGRADLLRDAEASPHGGVRPSWEERVGEAQEREMAWRSDWQDSGRGGSRGTRELAFPARSLGESRATPERGRQTRQQGGEERVRLASHRALGLAWKSRGICLARGWNFRAGLGHKDQPGDL